MKRVIGVLAAASLLLALAVSALAQQQTGTVVIKEQTLIQGPDGAPPPPDANIMFMATESFNGKTVKGAPYSADAVTETRLVITHSHTMISHD